MTLTQEKKTAVKQVMEETQRLLSEIYGTPVSVMYKIKSNHISPNLLLQVVLNHFKIKYSELVSQRRDAEVKLPRQLYCYLAKGYCGLTDQQIAEIINRDRTTATISIQKVKDMVDVEDAVYTEPLQQIEDAIMNLVKENV